MIRSTAALLDSGKGQKAKVWLNDLPLHSDRSLETKIYSCRSESKSGSRLKDAAVELYAPVGPMALYGLLGASFIHDESGELTVELRLSTSEEQLYKNALRTTADDVYIGLPTEYANSVESALRTTASTGNVRISGRLSATCSAHSLTASSNVAFRKVAAALFLLFCIGNADMDEDELEAMLSPLLFS